MLILFNNNNLVTKTIIIHESDKRYLKPLKITIEHGYKIAGHLM